ncbi:MAG: hypothetical protein KAH10_00825 [Flavobacteriales bacterium]|nr:hypothetical protein [Flavobacteriales bacterium]
MARIIVFFIVFVASMLISNRLFDTGGSDFMLIKLLVSGLIAGFAFWFITVRNDEEDVS